MKKTFLVRRTTVETGLVEAESEKQAIQFVKDAGLPKGEKWEEESIEYEAEEVEE